jgi:hypothetical protein
LLISDALQRFFPLHHGDGVCKAFQVFREASLIGSPEKPFRECLRVIGWKISCIPYRVPSRLQFAAAARRPGARAKGPWEGSAIPGDQVSWDAVLSSEAKSIDREKTLQDDTPPDHLSIVCRFLLYNPTPV